jgi:hypothetical protein
MAGMLLDIPLRAIGNRRAMDMREFPMASWEGNYYNETNINTLYCFIFCATTVSSVELS